MVQSRSLLIASAMFTLAFSHAPQDLGKRQPFVGVGIEKNKEGFGKEAVANDEYVAQFAPAPLTGESKNNSMQGLQDRSLELVERQSCDAGYWYCPSFSRCCPRSMNCCSYGYCIDPEDSCCPNGSCKPGWNCCGADTCSPPDGECCLDGNYCEAGNMCVKLGSSGRIVCCTDLDCTAAIVSGTTSIIETSTRDLVPTITRPPMTTEIVSIGETWTTWYWTVTWWYYSFYWSTFRAESTVTYTRIYETTTYTTTASDETEASSLFSALSKSLTFTPPESAQTSLATLLNVEPSETEDTSFSFGDFSSGLPKETSNSRRSSGTTSIPIITSNPSSSPVPGASTGSNTFVQWVLLGFAAASGVLMIAL